MNHTPTPNTLKYRLEAAKRCPYCPDQGWYEVANKYTGEPEQEQCEFCYTTADSLFNVINGIPDDKLLALAKMVADSSSADHSILVECAKNVLKLARGE